MTGPRFFLAAVLLGTSLASAEEPERQPTSRDPDDVAEAPLIPAAADTLSGHPLLSAGVLGLLPVGMLDGSTAFEDRAGLGVGVAGDLGFGLSRELVLGAWGEYVDYAHPSGCSLCDTHSFAVGPFARYHLIQGVRFDPWVSLGIGYRSLSAGGPNARTYTGIDWLKFATGGDWYALSQIGFGPYFETQFGTFTDRPAGRSATVYGNVSLGFRVTFDVRGR
jgi:hypothetical protein